MNTKQNFGHFYSILKRMHGVDKESIVWQYSNMRTESLSEFAQKDPAAYKAMLTDLEKKYPAEKPANPEQKRLRSAILHRLQKHGIDTTNWSHVNAFLLNPRIAGKHLFEMTNDEMYRLIPKLESILLKDATQRAHERYQAFNN